MILADLLPLQLHQLDHVAHRQDIGGHFRSGMLVYQIFGLLANVTEGQFIKVYQVGTYSSAMSYFAHTGGPVGTTQSLRPGKHWAKLLGC